MKSHHKQVHGESIAGITVNCKNCGEEKSVLPTYYEQFDKFFCDEQCRGEWRQENWTGENCPIYDKIEKDCSFCGETVYKTKWECARSTRHFCSRECQSKWQSESGVNSGENNAQWRGGGERYYGPNWPQIREEIRERDDYTCQKCSKEFDTDERGPVVHHIEKLRSFDSYSEANEEDNLVSLCDSCHAELEGLSVDEQMKRLK